MNTFKKFAIWTLRHAERVYLKAHGWKHLEGDDYVPPEGYEAKKHDRYHRCHAVAEDGTMASTRRAPERKIYPRPPIVEAIIEIRYQADVSNEQVFQALRDELNEKYRGEPRTQNRVQFVAAVEGDTVRSTTETLPHLTFLRTIDGQRLIGCAPGTLSVHVLAPYPGWERFLEQAQEAMNALPDAVRSGTINALAVRYIDRIVLPDGNANRFLTVMPGRPSRMPPELTAFHVVTESRDPNDGTVAVLTIANAPPEPDGRPALIYDLNMERAAERLCGFTDAKWVSIVEDLHQRQREIFEESITDRTRELFQ